MNVPGNMAVMNAAGGAVGPAPVMNQAVGRAHFEPDEQKRLNTYIYDYLLKLEKFDLARTFQQQCQIAIKQSTSPGRGVNGVDDMDTDSKDAVLKRPADLPIPELPGLSDNTTCFLYEWWCQFWDVYGARSKMSPAKANMVTVEYLQYNYVSCHMFAPLLDVFLTHPYRCRPKAARIFISICSNREWCGDNTILT